MSLVYPIISNDYNVILSNGKTAPLINLKIVRVIKLNYEDEYRMLPVWRIGLQNLEVASVTYYVDVSEKDLKSERLASKLFESYRAYFPQFQSWENSDLEGWGLKLTTELRRIIKHQHQSNGSEEYTVLYYGGWGTNNNYDIIYLPPHNSALRTLARVNYPAYAGYYNSILQMQIPYRNEEMQLKNRLDQFGRIKDKRTGLFLFLFSHYCYMSGLFWNIRIPEILSLEIPNKQLSDKLKKLLFGEYSGYGHEAVFSTTNKSEFIKSLEDTVDMPFIITNSINSGRNTLPSKLSAIQALQEEAVDKLSARMLFQKPNSVPIVISNEVLNNHGLIHIQIEQEMVSPDFMVEQIEDPQVYIARSVKWRISFERVRRIKEYVKKYENYQNSEYYVIFSYIYDLLNAIYGAKGISLEDYFGNDISIEKYLDDYLPQLLSVQIAHSRDFMEVLRKSVMDELLPVYERLGRTEEDCVDRDTLDNMPCILKKGKCWALNRPALEKLAGLLPGDPSRLTLLQSLNRAGILGKTINKQSYGNKLTVHLSDGDSVEWTLYEINVPEEWTKVKIDEPEAIIEGEFFKIGWNRKKEKIVNWDFERNKNINRNMFLTGKSGAGKSYFLNTMMKQAAEQNITMVVFHLQGEIPKIPNAIVYDIAVEKNSIKFGDQDVNKVANHLRSAFRLVNTQAVAVKQCLELYVSKVAIPTLHDFMSKITELGEELDIDTKRLKVRFYEAIEYKAFSATPIEWKNFEGRTLILDFRGLTDISYLLEAQAEFLLWDLFSYKEACPEKDIIVIVDEFQMLNTRSGSALNKVLGEGRKYGWSLWLCTQHVSRAGGSELKELLKQAAIQIYFAQSDQDNRKISGYLSNASYKKSDLSSDLQKLKRGEFLFALDAHMPVICETCVWEENDK